MLLVRRVFSIDVDLEARTVELTANASGRTPDFIDLEVADVIALASLGRTSNVSPPFCTGGR